MLEKIKNVFKDLIIPYKNFKNWTLLKILSFLSSLSLWFLCSLPVILLIFVVWYISPVEWKNIIESSYLTWSIEVALSSALLSHPLRFIVEWFLLWTLYFVFVTAYWYNTINLFNFYIKLYNKQDYKVLNKNYYDFKKLWKFFLLWLTLVLILLVFAIIFLIVIWVMILGFWGLDSLNNILSDTNSSLYLIFSLVSFLLGLFLILGFIYFAYRVSFVSMLMLEDEFKNEKFINLLKKSISITKWLSYFLFLWLVLCLVIVLQLVQVLENALPDSSLIIWIYVILKLFLFYWITEMYFVSIYKNIYFPRLGLKREIELSNDEVETEVVVLEEKVWEILENKQEVVEEKPQVELENKQDANSK